VRRYLRDHAWAVRVPRSLQERVLRVAETIDTLTVRNGRVPTARDVAAELSISLEDVLDALQARSALRARSLETWPGADDDGGPALAVDAERLSFVTELIDLRQLCDRLSQRDRLIVYLRVFEDLTQADIARRVGCSQMQVSRVLRKVL